MNNTPEDVIREVDSIIWDPDTSDLEKVHLVQGLLYQWDQCVENRSPCRDWGNRLLDAVDSLDKSTKEGA